MPAKTTLPQASPACPSHCPADAHLHAGPFRTAAPATPALPAEAGLTKAEESTLHGRLFPLLAAQMQKKTQGDSASMRVEEAAELMDSIQFTLRCQLAAEGLPLRALLAADLPALFAAGQHTVLGLLAQAKQLYEAACASVQAFGNRSLADTLRGIGGFFARYDARLYAHQIPADIDYQLCLPVPDALCGVLWVAEYLRRLLTENALLTRFDAARVTRLLARVHPDYGALLINLYEPAAANTVGLALLGGGETLLEVTPAQGARIYGLLKPLPQAGGEAMLQNAATAACVRLGLTGNADAAYLRETARALWPRLLAAPESYRGVFAVCEAGNGHAAY